MSAGILKLIVKLSRQTFEVNAGQKLLNGFCAHRRLERILVTLTHFTVFFLAEQLLFLQRGKARINNNIGGKVQHLFQQTRADVQHQADAGRNAFKVPNVRNGRSQLNVAHALTAHLGARYFYAAAVADFAFVTNAFIFSAVTLPVLLRSEDALTEQTVAFRLQGAVVDSFGFFYFAIAPLTDMIRRSQPDFD